MTKEAISTEHALKLALEALEFFKGLSLSMGEIERAEEAITALREAQPQPQPVGYVAENGVVDWNVCAPPIMTDLYTSPPTLSLAQPGREALEAAHTRLQKKYGELEGKVRRTWVELTDEDIDLFINGRGDEDDEDYVEPTGDGFGLTDDDLVILVRRAEAKLKEKNSD